MNRNRIPAKKVAWHLRRMGRLGTGRRPAPAWQSGRSGSGRGLIKPGHEPVHIDRRGRRNVLDMGFLYAVISRIPQPKVPDALRQRPFDTRPLFIALRPFSLGTRSVPLSAPLLPGVAVAAAGPMLGPGATARMGQSHSVLSKSTLMGDCPAHPRSHQRRLFPGDSAPAAGPVDLEVAAYTPPLPSLANPGSGVLGPVR